MRSKVLTCKTLPYYHDKREEHWINAFKNKIDNDRDISEVLENGGSQAKYSLNKHYANLLLYAIANKKTVSANSIFNDINWDNNERFKKYFFSVCGTYFESDKYKGDAYRIITFLREKNILKGFLKEYLNDKIVEELSRKDEETDQYLYANKVIFSALLKKHKIDERKINFTYIICPMSIMLTLSVLMASITIGPTIYHDLSTLEIFTQPLVIVSLCATLSLLLLGIAGSIWMSYAENNIPVEKMQQKLDAEQNSQGTASSEEQRVEEQAPTTVLEICLPRELKTPDTSFGNAVAVAVIVGITLGCIVA